MSVLKPRTATVTIFQGDDMDTLSALRTAAETARRLADIARAEVEDAGTPLRLGDSNGSEELAAAEAESKARQDAYDAAVDDCAERALVIELHSIGSKRFRDLMAEHPPRTVKTTVPGEPGEDGKPGPATEIEETHPDDVGYEVNTETFPAKLLSFIDIEDPTVRTIAAPEFASRKAVVDFLDNELADGDLPGLWTTAYYLNRVPSADPFQSRYSLAPRSSAGTSK